MSVPTVAEAQGRERALDPEVKAVLDAIGDSPYIDLSALPLEEAMRIARPPMTFPPPPAHTRDHQIKGYEGGHVRVRLYFPESRTAGLPVLVHFHGGGFVAGGIELDDSRCAWMAREIGCIVASVGYRLAPEHPFPIAIEDGYAAWNWVLDHAASFGGDAARCAISGSSAGGHIAVGATLLARERGARMPVLQLLAYPALDPQMSSNSYQQFTNGPFMTRARMAWYWKQYAGGAAPGGPLWAPLTAAVEGLPRAHVITAEYDVLRDEGEAWAARLQNASIVASTDRHAHMIHGFMTVVRDHDAARAALERSATVLRGVFA